MRILLIYNRYQYRGGEDTYVDSLLKLLKDKGHQVGTYMKDSREINERSFWEKLKIGLGMFWNLKVEKELSDLIKDFKPDIAHFHNIYPLISPIAYRICKKFKVPIVQTVHNYRFMCPKGILFRNGKVCELCIHKKFAHPSILHGCYHQSRLASVMFSSSFFFHRLIKSFDLIDAFIFPAEFTRDYYVKSLHIPLEKTYVIPHFVEGNEKVSNKEGKKDFFLFVGRLSEEKGIFPLLNIFVALPKIKLLVIGDGSLRREVIKFGKYKNIFIKNFLPKEKTYLYLNRALFTIIPSLWYEVFPMVLIESFGNGTPVIVPRTGAFKELVKEKQTGIFYEHGDYEALKTKITKVCENRQFIKKMSVFAREEFKNKYTSNRHYNLVLKLYHTLILRI